ncbi:MAG: hypothetical protein HN333_15990 [Rhodospirillaceae bacterium]|nr:hypothetical protein [Rhodospirillaceae bacterium]
MRRRLAVLARIRDVFERHGFAPMETPAFERLEVLAGKYGDEGDKLIFKILKRGEKAASGEADMALRYDLTVPAVRFYAHRRNELPRIFKRYQMGPVWRADRPGKGRFREFLQCDVDIFGSTSPLADIECLLTLAAALGEVGLPDFEIRLNSRRVLHAMMNAYGVAEPDHGSALVALDKESIVEDVIAEIGYFLVGPCSCQVKQLNPGVDFLIPVDWDGLITGMMGAEDILPALIVPVGVAVQDPNERTEPNDPNVPADPNQAADVHEPNELMSAVGEAPSEPGQAGGLKRNLIILAIVGLVGLVLATVSMTKKSKR